MKNPLKIFNGVTNNKFLLIERIRELLLIEQIH